MDHSKTWRRLFTRGPRPPRSLLRRSLRILLYLVILYGLASLIIRPLVPPPTAVGMSGQQYTAHQVQFLMDETWLDAAGERQLEQQIFDAIVQQISNAERLVLLDMFLFNAWQGPVPETHRALADEITDTLIIRRRQVPQLKVLVISDPINTVYDGLPSVHFERLRQAGIPVVLTDLTQLQDSNPLWSGVWRMLIQPLGNAPGERLPNPFGLGRVSLRSYLALLNFKANHRKLLVTDQPGGGLRALISSANPHDGSSAHRNVALAFSGRAVADLVAMEHALLLLSDAPEEARLLESVVRDVLSLSAEQQVTLATNPGNESGDDHDAVSATGRAQIQVLGESQIRRRVLQLLSAADAGDTVNLVMFYLADREIVRSLTSAAARGVRVRVLLDVNLDAFGRRKNGVPNRPVAAELHSAGVEVRWCATQGEQCHAKWLQVVDEDRHHFLLGSANFTRRNLQDFNLETSVWLQTHHEEDLSRQMSAFFERQWSNEAGRIYSLGYDQFADESLWLKLQYRFMEWSGLSTF